MTSPGTRRHRRVLRAAVVAVLVAAAIVLLFTVVFPWFDQTFVNDPVLGRGGLEALDR